MLDFWSAKNPVPQFKSYDFGFIMLRWVIFIDIKNSVMLLIQRTTIREDFENHKLKYSMKYENFNKVFHSF
jgi:hypothetical protein